MKQHRAMLSLAGAITTALIASMLVAAPAYADAAIAPPADLDVQGDFRVGETLRVPSEGWTPADVALDATWYVDGAPVTDPEEEADPLDLTLVPEWLGRSVSVDVVATSGDDLTTEISLEGAVVEPGVWNAPVPTVHGTGYADRTLTAELADVPADVATTYTWTIDGTEIPAATDAAYAPTTEQIGSSVSVRVTFLRAGYIETQTTSDPILITDAPPFPEFQAPMLPAKITAGTPATVTTGVWPAGTTLTYAYFVDGEKVAEGDTDSHVFSSDAVGRAASVTVTAQHEDYATLTLSSDIRTVTGTFTESSAPRISGTVRVGTRLTAVAGTLDPVADSNSYAWKIDGKTVSTSTSFTPSTTLRGKTLTLTVTSTRESYDTVVRTTPAAKIGAGVFASAPTPKISGSAKVGAVLKVSTGTWSPSATLKYQWNRNGAPIKGATSSSYRVTSTDWKKKITVTVTAVKTAYTTTKRGSASTSAVVKPFTKTTAPKITGTLRVGATLKASVSGWSPTATYTYQWKRSGVPIPGATRSTYRLTTTDFGRTITVTVTGKRSTYASTPRSTSASKKIAAPLPVISKAGTYKVGTGGIKPGTYYASATAGCYWERRSSAGSSLSGIIANDFRGSSGRVVVTIKSTDRYFKTDRECGSWRPLVGTISSSAGNGTHVVGKHIRAGLYRTTNASGSCYWEIVSGFGGTFGEIVENDRTSARTNYVYVYANDKGFTSSGCGTWKWLGYQQK